MDQAILEVLKMFVVASILFVWVIRYSNIVAEFKSYSLPSWLRDLVGIFKIAFALMLLNADLFVVQIGALGIAALMLCALGTHVKVKNPFAKMLPATALLIINLAIYKLS